MSKICDIEKLPDQKKADKWWDKVEKKAKNEDKWTTLVHNGIALPDTYIPIPSSIKILYNGKPIKLDSKNISNPFRISAEEAAYYFSQAVEADIRIGSKNSERVNRVDSTFKSNFWKDWKVILEASGEKNIKDMNKVDFMPIVEYIANSSIQKKKDKKVMSKEEITESKQESEEVKGIFGYALVDGVKIAIGGYKIQKPGFYAGHGEQPLRGRIVRRIIPEDVTLNASREPKCFFNGKECEWGSVIEDRTATWIARWRHPVTDKLTYVQLKREESTFVCANDIGKFQVARELAKNIDDVRKKYTKSLSSSVPRERQLATAVYLLDILAIRPGTEKDETKETLTKGLTTLEVENVALLGNKEVKIDFIGKSSIKFAKVFKVSLLVYKNLQELTQGKHKNELIFPYVTGSTLNDYLKTLMPDLTAKVFRTYKAAVTLQEELQKNIPSVDASDIEKKLAYDRANTQVALILNHKNMTVSSDKVSKLLTKIKEAETKAENSRTPKQKESAQRSKMLSESKLEQAEQNISLATSKTNYIDPRISVAWAKKCEIPIEKLYTKVNLKKFIWAMSTPSSWKF